MSDDARRTPEPEFIPAALLERLNSNDSGAWLEFLQKVWGHAWEQVDDALKNGLKEADPKVQAVIRAYQGKVEELPAALQTALTNFRGLFTSGQSSHRLTLKEATREDCVLELLRITYNRWQNGDRREKVMRAAAALGAAGPRDGRYALLDAVADRRPGPEDGVDLADFFRNLNEEVVEFALTMKGKYIPEIVFMRLYQNRTYEDIATVLGLSPATAQRKVELLLRHLRKRFSTSADGPAGPD